MTDGKSSSQENQGKAWAVRDVWQSGSQDTVSAPLWQYRLGLGLQNLVFGASHPWRGGGDIDATGQKCGSQGMDRDLSPVIAVGLVVTFVVSKKRKSAPASV